MWGPGSGIGGAPTPAAALCCPRRFVSDQAPRGMAALCQHKLLGAMEQTHLAPRMARAHPPTQLEWTAGWRRGRMALDIFTFNGDAHLLLRPPHAYRGASPASSPSLDPLPASALRLHPSDPDHRVLSWCPLSLSWNALGTIAPLCQGLLPLTPAPTPCPYRGVLLCRGGVLDHGRAVRRVDSAEQVQGPGVGCGQH